MEDKILVGCKPEFR